MCINACHTVCLVENMLEAETIHCMKWLVCSPDKNPIKYICNMFRKYVAMRPRPPFTVYDLEIVKLKEWNSIPLSLIDNLITS